MAAVLGVAGLSESLLIERLREKMFPVGWFRDGPWAERQIGVRAGAPPWPKGCFPDQAGGKRVAFDIGGGFYKGHRSLHGVTAKAVLINRSSAHIFMADAPTHGVGGSKPVHESTQDTGFPGSAEQVPVVGHNAKGKD